MKDGMWIDEDGAEEMIAAMSADPSRKDLAPLFQKFLTDGYCVMPGAVSVALIDSYNSQLEKALDAGGKLLISHGLNVLSADGWDIRKPLTKILDLYVPLPAAQALAFAPPVQRFLRELFEQEPLAFQGLHFEVGSTQAVHQDTAYVVVNQPRSFAAAWIALEDILPGSGELVYYPGSHRLGPFMYGNRRSWRMEEDGHEIHDHHLAWLHSESRAHGIKLERFLPRKGDVLIWHADLAHGGGEIADHSLTRRSLVIHYCPAKCIPNYFQFLEPDRQVKRKVGNDGFMSSFYYPV